MKNLFYSLFFPIYEKRHKNGKLTDQRFSDISKLIGYNVGCNRCGLTWNSTKMHTTFFQLTEGVSVICEKCYDELETPENRWEFYLNTMKSVKYLQWMCSYEKEIKKCLFYPWWEEKLKKPSFKMDNSGLISVEIKSDQLKLELI